MILKKRQNKKPEPHEGDYKVETFFAWWPKRTDDGLIWLERYKEISEWVTRERVHFLGRFTFWAAGAGWDLRQTKRVKQ